MAKTETKTTGDSVAVQAVEPVMVKTETDARDAFLEDFSVPARQRPYVRGRLSKVKKADDIDGFLNEFAASDSIRSRMRASLEPMVKDGA